MFCLSYLSLEVPGRFDLYPRYASLAFRTLSQLDFISSRGIRCMSLALWSFERKCSKTAEGLELLVCLSTGLRCSLKRSLSRRLVSPLCNSDCIVPCK